MLLCVKRLSLLLLMLTSMHPALAEDEIQQFPHITVVSPQTYYTKKEEVADATSEDTTQVQSKEDDYVLPATQDTPTAEEFPHVSVALQPTQYTTKKKRRDGPSVRIFLNQEGTQASDYNPLNPSDTERYTTTLMYEYTPASRAFSIGVLPVFITSKTRYQNTPTIINFKSVGLIPFISSLFTPSWHGLLQIGAYVDHHDLLFPQFRGGGIPNDRLQIQGGTYFVAGFLTWIGPEQPLTGSVRAGWIHGLQHIGSGVDTFGRTISGTDFVPGSNFEFSGPYLSGRLKYNPNEDWELYLQAETEYHLRSSPRINTYLPQSGRQRSRYTVGPGVHYRINDHLEARFSYQFAVGWGYRSSHDLMIRLRAALP